jgi:hypothetical protein
MDPVVKVVVVDASASPPDMKALKRNGVLGVVVRSTGRHRSGGKVDAKAAAAPASPAEPTAEAKVLGAASAADLLGALMLPLSDDMAEAVQAAALPDGSRLFIEAKDGAKPSEVSQQISKLRSVIGIEEPNVVLTLRLGQKTTKDYAGLFDGTLTDWTDLWIVDDSREALAGDTPTWPKSTYARWRLWEFGQVDFGEVGKFPGSTYNGLDEEFERWFVGSPPPSASELANAQVGL